MWGVSTSLSTGCLLGGMAWERAMHTAYVSSKEEPPLPVFLGGELWAILEIPKSRHSELWWGWEWLCGGSSHCCIASVHALELVNQ